MTWLLFTFCCGATSYCGGAAGATSFARAMRASCSAQKKLKVVGVIGGARAASKRAPRATGTRSAADLDVVSASDGTDGGVSAHNDIDVSSASASLGGVLEEEEQQDGQAAGGAPLRGRHASL